jgi:hypothetical protein
MLLVTADALSQPILAFDARAIWGMKAKILFHTGGIYGEDFEDPSRLHAHQQYPLLLPMAENLVYRALGRIDDCYGKSLFPPFLLSLVLLVYSALRRSFHRSYSLAGAAFLACLPVFVIFANGGVASGYADFPLACFVTSLVLALVFWMETACIRYLCLSAFFGTFTLFTKNEGTALWAITLACFGVVILASSLKLDRRLLLLVLSACLTWLTLLPWREFRSHLPLNDENYSSLLTATQVVSGSSRAPFVAKAFLKEYFLKPHLWNLLGLTLMFTAGVTPRRYWKQKHQIFLLIPLLYSILLFVIFLITPWRLEELMPISLSRLVMHTAPLLVLWIWNQAGFLLPERLTGWNKSGQAIVT